jgi:hypothetical protein
MNKPDPVELFKLLVGSNHSLAAVDFWLEHFGWGNADRPPHLAEFRRECLDECRRMFQWIRDATQTHPTLGYVGHDICQKIVSDVVCGHRGDADYREAALFALDDPVGDQFFTRLEELEKSDQELDDEPNDD